MVGIDRSMAATDTDTAMEEDIPERALSGLSIDPSQVSGLSGTERPRPPPVQYVDLDSPQWQQQQQAQQGQQQQQLGTTNALLAPRGAWLQQSASEPSSTRFLQSTLGNPQLGSSPNALTSPRGAWLEEAGYARQVVVLEAEIPLVPQRSGSFTSENSWSDFGGIPRARSVEVGSPATSRPSSFIDERGRLGSGSSLRSSSCQSGQPGTPSTPQLLVTDDRDDESGVTVSDEILKSVAAALRAQSEAGKLYTNINLVPDAIFDMGTKDYNAFMRREKFDAGLVKLLKESRRRYKNRIYAKISREKTKREAGSRSPSLSPRVSPRNIHMQPSDEGDSSESMFDRAITLQKMS